MDSNEDLAKSLRERVCLCVFCGLPAVGKSTLAHIVRSLASQQGWRTTVISYDDLIPDGAFHLDAAEQTQTKWKVHRQAVLKCIEQFLLNPQALATTCEINEDAWRRCVGDGLVSASTVGSQTNQLQNNPPHILLLDDNFYYPSMRYEVYQLARRHSLGFCQVYVKCPVESCISRNQSRARPVPCQVIENMARHMEPPNPDRHPWEQSSVSLDTTGDFTEETWPTLMELLSAALGNPLSPVQDNTEQREADRLSCANSVVHQADQTCRRLVSQTMQRARENQISSDHMRLLAAELNKSKTRFLQDLRKQVLQGLPILPGESIDVERVVKRAVGIFEQDLKEVTERFLMKDVQ